MQIRLAYFTPKKYTNPIKAPLKGEKKQSSRDYIVPLQCSQTVICIFILNAPLNPPLCWHPWVLPSLRWVCPTQPGTGWAELAPGSFWPQGCGCGSASLQGFAAPWNTQQGWGQVVIMDLNHCCTLGQYRPLIIKYMPNFKYNFQLDLTICSTSMYSLFFTL